MEAVRSAAIYIPVYLRVLYRGAWGGGQKFENYVIIASTASIGSIINFMYYS